MAQIGTLITGAGIPTPISGLAQLEANIVIGDVDTANPLQGINFSIDQETFIDIQGSAPLVNTFAKLFQPLTATVVGLVFKIATGRLFGSGALRLTNAGATTPAIFNYSTESKSRLTGQKAVPIRAFSDSINAQQNTTYKAFTALAVVVANVSSFDVTFWDDTVQNMAAVEVDALFATQNETEANGRLDPLVSCFDNRDRKFKSVKVNAGAGGAVTVMKVNLPEGYFQAEKAAIDRAAA